MKISKISIIIFIIICVPFCVFMHEVGHYLAALSFGFNAKLHYNYISFDLNETIPHLLSLQDQINYVYEIIRFKEFIIVLVGPLVNIFIMLISFILALVFIRNNSKAFVLNILYAFTLHPIGYLINLKYFFKNVNYTKHRSNDLYKICDYLNLEYLPIFYTSILSVLILVTVFSYFFFTRVKIVNCKLVFFGIMISYLLHIFILKLLY